MHPHLPGNSSAYSSSNSSADNTDTEDTDTDADPEFSELAVADSMDRPALKDVPTQKLRSMAAEAEHTEHAAALITHLLNPDSVNAGYEEDTRLGKLTIFFEYYDYDTPPSLSDTIDFETVLETALDDAPSTTECGSCGDPLLTTTAFRYGEVTADGVLCPDCTT